MPTRVGPGADGSPRRLVIRSFPYRHWLLAAFLLFLAGFMFFRIVRGTVEDIIVEIANTGWWQYAAAGLLCSIALAVAAQGEVRWPPPCAPLAPSSPNPPLTQSNFPNTSCSRRLAAGYLSQVEMCRFDKVCPWSARVAPSR